VHKGKRVRQLRQVSNALCSHNSSGSAARRERVCALFGTQCAADQPRQRCAHAPAALDARDNLALDVETLRSGGPRQADQRAGWREQLEQPQRRHAGGRRE
jgi:hypothetical protein